MTIYLIRHGQTTGDIENRYGGAYDDHLTDEGRIQAEKLAKQLSNKQIESIFYSPLHRAKETALILQKKTKSTLEEVSGLQERNRYGMLTGIVKEEALKVYPQLVALLSNDKNTLPEAESYEVFRSRVIESFAAITASQYTVIAVITHGGPIKLILHDLVDRDITTIADCGYIVLEKHDHELSVLESEGIVF